MIGSRNNTNFQYQLHNFLKTIKINEKDYLRYHQKIVVEYLLEYPDINGILLYHKMGSGKTMLAVSICEVLIEKTNKNIIFVAAKSLHKNFIKEFEKYNKVNTQKTQLTDNEIKKHLENKYTFISANAGNMAEQFKKAVNKNKLASLVLELDEDKKKTSDFIEMDNSIVVWDEFHNFTNSVSSGSKNATSVYDILTKSKDVKCIALTGTPIINDPFEITLAMNIFAGQPVFSEYYSDFNRDFVNNGNTEDIKKNINIKNKSIFQDRIMGLISYYGADDLEFKKNFPKQYEISVKKIKMSEEQFAEYIYYREKEIKQTAQSFFKTVGRFKSSSASSSYRVGTRQVSNFLFPEHAITRKKNEEGRLVIKKFPDKITSDDLKPTGIRKYSPKIYNLLETLSLHLPEGILSKFKPNSATINKIIENLSKLNNIRKYQFGVGSGIIYSQFMESGLEIIGKILENQELEDITHTSIKVDNISKSQKNRFAFISGKTDPERRKELVEIYNCEKNIKGECLCLLLITSTGAEGLDLHNGRHVHILEPYWNYSRIEQVITRLVRYKSHIELPENERNVQPYIYLSDYPNISENEKIRLKNILSEPSTDIYLFVKALKNQNLINEFLNSIQETSIDCLLHYKDSKECRICEPTNKKLFTNNILSDIEKGSACEQYKQEDVIANEIIIEKDGTQIKYMYSQEDSGKYNIYKYDKELDGYTEVSTDNEDYYLILNELKKIKKQK